MEPPGGLPPDRDRQLVLRPAQPQQLASAKPTLTLNLPHSHQQQALTTIATSPAAAALIAACGNNNATSTLTAPALASTATAISATTQAATAFSGSSVAHHNIQHHHHHAQQPLHHNHPPLQQNSSSASSSLLGGLSGSSGQQQTIEKLSRPLAFDKMESLVREMQDPENGVPVRQQKMFLTSIPYAFMGYDLIEWLMDRLLIEESEALNIANQLCLHGYFFPVNDTKTLTVKDDSSLYRFQTPYYWPWQHKAPDNVEYAIYLAKRSLRNKQRHALEDYEAEALASLHKNLKGKWDFISMQAEEQVRLAKERKKGDKIVGDSQERAYWRVHRPPPGQFTPLEPCPIPSRDRQGSKPNKKKSIDDVQREVDYLKKSLNRTRMKMSHAVESLVCYSETFTEYDFFLQPVLPSNPWVTEDITFWQLNNTFVDIPTEKRVKRWAISIEELVCDPTGLQEFTSFLEKEYSHENIRFWTAVNRLRRSAHSQVARKVNEIYEEFLKPGAPCEINIDGKTMESVLKGLKSPSRFTFDSASEHIYMLLLKKDTYPRFIRSDHYKRLLETGIQPSHKKRFFNFGGVSGAKKKMTAALSSQPGDGSSKSGSSSMAPPPGHLARRRGSDRSLTGSAHELAVIGVNKDVGSKVPHSHSQSNLSEIPYSSEAIYRGDMPHHHAGIYAAYGNRDSSLHTHQETPKPKSARLETTVETASSAVCPWDLPDEPPTVQAPAPTQVKLSICPWEQDSEPSPPAVKANNQRLTSTSSDNSDVSERIQRNLGIRHQNTVDSGEAGMKRLIPNFTEQRRASVSFTPSRLAEYQFGRPSSSTKTSTTPSPTVGSQSVVDTAFPPLFTPMQAHTFAAIASVATSSVIMKDPPSDVEIEDELNKLAISEPTVPAALPPPSPTPPPITKITPPPPENTTNTTTALVVAAAAETQTQTLTEIEDNPRESPKSESRVLSDEHEAIVEGGETEIETATETEVEAMVQEVQIELIEAAEFEGKSPQKFLEAVATPTIQVQEPYMSGHLEQTPALKSPHKLDTEAEVESALAFESESHKSPTKVRSVTQSPDREHSAAASDSEKELLAIVPTLNAALAAAAAPPPPPEMGPMEEEEQLQDDEPYAMQEELSPTTEEYQEGLQFGEDNKDVYEYDIVDTDSRTGYIAPAPTPAPSMAPLAVLDVDTVGDDESCDEIKQTPPLPVPAAAELSTPTEEVKKRRKKRNSDGRKMTSLEEKDKEKDKASSSSVGGGTEGNTVCPWEDENVASDGTFVKTYATLGYL